ncbi:MAG: hypothetical protein N3B17_08155 [Chlorobi bacterium]|nr:hypothetical protein [Chlorobiota bacterium]
MSSSSKLLVVLVLLLAVKGWGQWSEPVRIPSLSSQADDFAPSWSPADSTLYFARQSGGGRLQVLACRGCTADRLLAGAAIPLDTVRDSIPYAAFNGSRWVGHRMVRGSRQSYAALVSSPSPYRNFGSAVPIGELSFPERFVMFPALSPDGGLLVFAATTDSSELTMDLWVSRWNGSQWSTPYPLDGFEQSPESEITPCFVGSDTLVFASNGFGGKGGFDLFMTVRTAGQWSPPMPLALVNSQADERDPCVLPSGDLLFVSNRAGSFDIYLARRKKNERP